MIADEDDGFDAGLLAFLDLENQVDAIVRPLDDLRHYLHVKTSVAVIHLDDALHVRLHDGARERAARSRLNLLLQLVVFDLVAAFEGQAVDDGSLDHGHDQPAAGLGDADVLEQTGGVERLEGSVDLGGIETFAWHELEVGADRIGFDAAVALHDNRTGVRGRRRTGTPDRFRRGAERHLRTNATQHNTEEQARYD